MTICKVMLFLGSCTRLTADYWSHWREPTIAVRVLAKDAAEP
jgi:hypothetical protein